MDDTELINIFWTEVEDYLERMNALIMALEMSLAEDDAGGFVERLRELNRLAHSMKGAARAVGFPDLETIGHHMEEIFDASLKRGLALTTDVCDTLYDALDFVSARAAGQDMEQDVLNTVILRLEAVVNDGELAGTDIVHSPETDTEIETTTDAVEDMPPVNSGPSPESDSGKSKRTPSQPQTLTALNRVAEDSVRLSVEKLNSLMALSSELLVTRLQAEESKSQVDRMRGHHARWGRSWRTVRAAYIRLVRRLQNEDELSEDLHVISEFLELNQQYLMESTRHINSLAGKIANDTTQLSAVADAIQDGVGSLRLVAFDTIIPALGRSLRDAAHETDKTVHFDVVGGSTEIDKTVIAQLKDPLMHLIRNSVDHGIELPEEREAIGKEPAGWITLLAAARGSEIVIQVQDDGRGLDVQALRASAEAAGMLNPDIADQLTDADIRAMIFQPGLTTREKVTAISGRGVGLDVVRTRVEALRGRVVVDSQPGQGTTISIHVPVSLSRIRCVIVGAGDEKYAIPALSVTRMERLQPDAIFIVDGQRYVNLGSETLPIYIMGDVLGSSRTESDPDVRRCIVLNGAERRVAYEVDEFLNERELVLKPLGPELANTKFVSGAALLGTGQVVIVLDGNDLTRTTNGMQSSLLNRNEVMDALPTRERESHRIRVLIVDDSITTRTLEKNILENAGCDVRVAFDGVQAWEIIRENVFDVVVSDVEMPRMNGLELTRRIKSLPETKELPVILLTSLSKPEHQEAGLQAGADAYLVKSKFDQTELLQAIHRVI